MRLVSKRLPPTNHQMLVVGSGGARELSKSLKMNGRGIYFQDIRPGPARKAPLQEVGRSRRSAASDISVTNFDDVSCIYKNGDALDGDGDKNSNKNNNDEDRRDNNGRHDNHKIQRNGHITTTENMNFVNQFQNASSSSVKEEEDHDEDDRIIRSDIVRPIGVPPLKGGPIAAADRSLRVVKREDNEEEVDTPTTGRFPNSNVKQVTPAWSPPVSVSDARSSAVKTLAALSTLPPSNFLPKGISSPNLETNMDRQFSRLPHYRCRRTPSQRKYTKWPTFSGRARPITNLGLLASSICARDHGPVGLHKVIPLVLVLRNRTRTILGGSPNKMDVDALSATAADTAVLSDPVHVDVKREDIDNGSGGGENDARVALLDLAAASSSAATAGRDRVVRKGMPDTVSPVVLRVPPELTSNKTATTASMRAMMSIPDSELDTQSAARRRSLVANQITTDPADASASRRQIMEKMRQHQMQLMMLRRRSQDPGGAGGQAAADLGGSMRNSSAGLSDTERARLASLRDRGLLGGSSNSILSSSSSLPARGGVQYTSSSSLPSAFSIPPSAGSSGTNTERFVNGAENQNDGEMSGTGGGGGGGGDVSSQINGSSRHIMRGARDEFRHVADYAAGAALRKFVLLPVLHEKLLNMEGQDNRFLLHQLKDEVIRRLGVYGRGEEVLIQRRITLDGKGSKHKRSSRMKGDARLLPENSGLANNRDESTSRSSRATSPIHPGREFDEEESRTKQSGERDETKSDSNINSQHEEANQIPSTPSSQQRRSKPTVREHVVRACVKKASQDDAAAMASWYDHHGDKVLPYTSQLWSEWWVRRCKSPDVGCEMIKLIVRRHSDGDSRSAGTKEKELVLGFAYFERNVTDIHPIDEPGTIPGTGDNGNANTKKKRVLMTLLRGIRTNPLFNPEVLRRKSLTKSPPIQRENFLGIAANLCAHVLFRSLLYGTSCVGVNSIKNEEAESFYASLLGDPVCIREDDGRRYYRLHGDERWELLGGLFRYQLDLWHDKTEENRTKRSRKRSRGDNNSNNDDPSVTASAGDPHDDNSNVDSRRNSPKRGYISPRNNENAGGGESGAAASRHQMDSSSTGAPAPVKERKKRTRSRSPVGRAVIPKAEESDTTNSQWNSSIQGTNSGRNDKDRSSREKAVGHEASGKRKRSKNDGEGKDDGGSPKKKSLVPAY